MIQLKIGDPAPGFSALDQHSREVNLKNFEGSRLFVFFYPKANTTG